MHWSEWIKCFHNVMQTKIISSNDFLDQLAQEDRDGHVVSLCKVKLSTSRFLQEYVPTATAFWPNYLDIYSFMYRRRCNATNRYDPNPAVFLDNISARLNSNSGSQSARCLLSRAAHITRIWKLVCQILSQNDVYESTMSPSLLQKWVQVASSFPAWLGFCGCMET